MPTAIVFSLNRRRCACCQARPRTRRTHVCRVCYIRAHNLSGEYNLEQINELISTTETTLRRLQYAKKIILGRA